MGRSLCVHIAVGGIGNLAPRGDPSAVRANKNKNTKTNNEGIINIIHQKTWQHYFQDIFVVRSEVSKSYSTDYNYSSSV